jgi:hypothetical protein
MLSVLLSESITSLGQRTSDLLEKACTSPMLNPDGRQMQRMM